MGVWADSPGKAKRIPGYIKIKIAPPKWGAGRRAQVIVFYKRKAVSLSPVGSVIKMCFQKSFKLTESFLCESEQGPYFGNLEKYN